MGEAEQRFRLAQFLELKIGSTACFELSRFRLFSGKFSTLITLFLGVYSSHESNAEHRFRESHLELDAAGNSLAIS